jgi:truncated hemoglobin YjbI
MAKGKQSKYPTRHGYMSEKIQRDYITFAVAQDLLPPDAHRLAQIVSLNAPVNETTPIQFWQLYSVLGQDPIVTIVQNFYERVFADEHWFTSVFARVGGIGHHINTQAAMWIDVMGGGPYYHGAEFRLNFHHTHNAFELMNDKGAQRWSQLMLDTLNDTVPQISHDPRIRISINTFLAHFMTKYAEEFSFSNQSFFGETNPAIKRKINFMKMTKEDIEGLSEAELNQALQNLGVNVADYPDKKALISKVLMM